MGTRYRLPMHGKTATDTPMHGDQERLNDSTEARERLGNISERSFRRLCKTGALQAVKQGTRVYVRESVLIAYIDNLPAA
jgi:hypothetical protein